MEPSRPPDGRRIARGLTAAAFLVLALVVAVWPRGAEAQYLSKVGSFVAPTGGPSQSITGVGFTPRAVIFFWTAQSAGGFATNASAGYGFATGAGSERAVGFASDDNLSAPSNNPARWQWTTRCIAVVANAAAAATDAEASLTSMDVDGFSLNWPVRNTAWIIHYLALGGPNITDAAVGSFTPTAGTGSQSVGGLAFSPQFLMFLSIDSNTVGSRVTPDGKVSLGYAGLSITHGITQGGITAASRTGAANIITGAMQRSDAAILEKPTSVAGVSFVASVTSFDASGFTINKTVNVGGTETPVHYLALRGGQYRVGEIRRPLVAGPQTVAYTGVGFEPQGLLFSSWNLASQVVPDEEARISFSAADNAFSGAPLRPNQRATFFHDKSDNPADSDFSWVRQGTSGTAGVNGKVGFLAQAGDCPPLFPDPPGSAQCSGGPRLISEAEVASYGINGFTLSWTANDLANMNQNPGDEMNAQVLYVAFGPPPPQTNYRSIGVANDYAGAALDGIVVTNGSTNVTKTGGLGWLAQNRGRGDVLTVGANSYVIAAVNSNNQLTLASPAVANYSANVYTIARQFRGGGVSSTALANWEDCVDGPPGTPCPAVAPVASNDLVADDRREVGIAYDDAVFGLTADFAIDGSITDATHTITLTADGQNRHNGVPGAGVVIDANLGPNEILVQDSNVTVEWLELTGLRGGGSQSAIRVMGFGNVPQNVLLQNLLIHNFLDPTPTIDLSGIRLSGNPGKSVTVRNVMIWNGDQMGIAADEVGDALTIENCSIDDMRDSAGSPRRGVFTDITTGVVVRNTIATRSGTDFAAGLGSFAAASTNNISSDATAPGANPLTATAPSLFVNPGNDLHLIAGAVAIDTGVSLAPGFSYDIDGTTRPAGAGWDRGADEFGATTEVDLLSFVAVALDGAVELQWETASETNNLGFYLYRSGSPAGPFQRITPSPIPGLGSSPVGARYRHVDRAVVNGGTYYYLLEDYETTGKTKRHGPVLATPRAGAPSPDEGGGPDASPAATPARVAYGDPDRTALRVLERTRQGLLVELTTGGFFAEPQGDGSVRLIIPGFSEENTPGSPAIPTRRAWLEVMAGKRVRLVSVRALEVAAFPGVHPLAAEAREVVSSRSGALRVARRRRAEGRLFRSGRLYPEDVARLLETAFQGETKKALLELAPLRWDPRSGRLLLARRLLVRLSFAGVEPDERSQGGSRGRRYKAHKSQRRHGVVARLATEAKGLYAVRYEELFADRRGIDGSRLGLSRQGGPIAYHLEPDAGRFGPGSVLYFFSEGGSANPYGKQAVYELELGEGAGLRMPTASAPPGWSSQETYRHRLEREENLAFAAQLPGESLWVWASLLASASRSLSFEASRVAAGSEPARLEVWLLGISGTPGAAEHRVRLFLNGQLVGEPSWNSTSLEAVAVEFSPSLVQEGANTLVIENANSFYSAVMVDRFALDYPRQAVAEAGVFAGRFGAAGTASVAGLYGTLAGTPSVLELGSATPRWLSGAQCTPVGCRFAVEAEHAYFVAQAPLRPFVERARPGRLKDRANRYDYLVIAPEALVEAARPLVEQRQGQGLASLLVSTEEIYDEFGFGEGSPQAIRDFLGYAFHEWTAPAPRYVLLLGDGSYDYKDYLKTGSGNPVPPLLFRSSFLWTASDPLYAAVNGEDSLPDLALGRLPASTPEDARIMIEKILAFENAGLSLDGPAVLVSDNPDAAGDFDAEADEIAAGVLASRQPSRISLARRGVDATRAAIVDAFAQGPSLMSYLGHGSQLLWAHENIFHASQVAALSPRLQQPFVLTLNCLNGFFHHPQYDSLSEELVKAEARGAIAAFSPSGLSFDDAAHVFHKAFLAELVREDHERLGDALLAAQAAYADSGATPEMIDLYHLFGDPALRIR